MIFEFLSRLEPELRKYIYSINEQDGLEFHFQVSPEEDQDDIQCYKVSYIQFEDYSDFYTIESDTDSKVIWAEGLEAFLQYLEVLKALDWSKYN